jgi:hypothetical protein
MNELYLTVKKVDVVQDLGPGWNSHFDLEGALRWLPESRNRCVGQRDDDMNAKFCDLVVGYPSWPLPGNRVVEQMLHALWLDSQDRDSNYPDIILLELIEFANSIVGYRNRRVCFTEGGKLCLVPGLSQIEDSFYKIDNLKELLLLRTLRSDERPSTSKSKFQLVGTSYNPSLWPRWAEEDQIVTLV